MGETKIEIGAETLLTRTEFGWKYNTGGSACSSSDS